MKITDPDLREELAAVRSATAKYHDIETALADGYVRVTPFVPGMGFHYQKISLVGDGKVDLNQPEALLYLPQPEAGHYKLVSVEYLVLKTGDEVPVEGFTGDQDPWHVLPAVPGVHPAFWTLHAWIWEHNPAGMFHDTNPRIGDSP